MSRSIFITENIVIHHCKYRGWLCGIGRCETKPWSCWWWLKSYKQKERIRPSFSRLNISENRSLWVSARQIVFLSLSPHTQFQSVVLSNEDNGMENVHCSGEVLVHRNKLLKDCYFSDQWICLHRNHYNSIMKE